MKEFIHVYNLSKNLYLARLAMEQYKKLHLLLNICYI
jgi:hypothetical protein